ncbi:hypothetical protein BMS3Bbin08_00473 [bacterium BMS3Bbin08]|nr:hypothetical protein BMS3Bbin08_00473 [bacterium BMS3Bbin08]HDH51604.1 hypothetical protein [Nitrospirota bacterium]
MVMRSEPGNKIKFIIIFLFLLNLFAGLFLINEGLFQYDSIHLAEAVENTYKTGQLQPAVRGRYGSVIVTSILYWPSFILGHNADFTTRFASVLFHSLSIVMLFLFINELFGNRIQALFGAVLLSFTPFYFSSDTYGKEHGMSMFFLLLSFFLVYRGVKNKSLVLIGISSFAIAFASSIREAMLVVTPLYFILYLNPEISIRPFKITIPRERFDPKMLFSLLLPFLFSFCVMYLTYLKPVIYNELFLRDTGTVVFLGIFTPVLKLVVHDLYKSVPLLLFVFFIIGVIRIGYKENFFLAIFLLLWVMPIFYFGNTQTYSPRYLDVIMVPVYIFASYALSDLYGKNKIITYIVIVYFVGSMFVFMYPMLKFRHHYNGAKQFALYVKEKTEEDAVIITSDDRPFIRYYSDRKTINYPINPAAYTKEVNDFVNKIDKLLMEGVPVYVTEWGLNSYDPDNILGTSLAIKFNISIIGEKLSEDYHRPDMKLDLRNQKLFKIDLR